MRKVVSFLVWWSLLPATASSGAVLEVPGQYPTIQAALNLATDGDEIVVQAGTYGEMIDLLGKRVVLRSSEGASSTIIQAVGLGPVVRCDHGETAETIIDGFTITGADSGQGGVYIAGSSPTVRACVIAGNSGNSGAGMLLSESNSLIQRCTFTRNHSGIGSSGAGLSSTGKSHAVIEECLFEGNIASSGGGGAHVTNGAHPTIRRCTFRNNKAGEGSSAGEGGGLSVDVTAGATVIECLFESNSATSSAGGGGVSCAGQSDYTDCVFRDNAPNGLEKQRSGVLTRCLFQDNVVGMLVIANTSAPQVIDCAFIDNSSHGFHTDTAFPTLVRCQSRGNGGAGFRSHRSGTIMIDCVAHNNGDGGLWSTQSGSAQEVFEQLTNCLLVSNGADGIFATRSRMVLTNCTIADNALSGLSINVGIPGVGQLVPTLRNCIVWGNTLGTFAGNAPTASFCLAQSLLAGTANTVADPLFADSTAGDYQVTEGSPAIDTGDNAAVSKAILTNLAGAPRIVDGNLDGIATVDRGAFEFQAVVSMDVRPGSCPNMLNRNSNGVLPVGLAGEADFNVHDVDISTLRLSRTDGIGGSVAPNEGPPGPHTVVSDIATPFEGKGCGCHTLQGDGIPDLSMKFRTPEVVDALALNALPPGTVVPLTLRGTLNDGTPFRAFDCITLVPGAKPASQVTSESITFIPTPPP